MRVPDIPLYGQTEIYEGGSAETRTPALERMLTTGMDTPDRLQPEG